MLRLLQGTVRVEGTDHEDFGATEHRATTSASSTNRALAPLATAPTVEQ